MASSKVSFFCLLAGLLSHPYGIAAVPVHERFERSDNGTIQPSIPGGHWVDTWTAMPQLTEFTNLPNPPFVCREDDGSTFKTNLTQSIAESKRPSFPQFYDSTNTTHVNWLRADSYSDLECFRT